MAGWKQCCNIKILDPSSKFKCFTCRSFFNIPVLPGKSKYYHGRKIVGYSMEQMFTVVADVENYTKFVPFCKKSLVRVKAPTFMMADLVIGFPPIYERYTSRITLDKPRIVKAECTDGRLFNHLQTIWKFEPGLKDFRQSCVTDFSVAFEFKSVLHSQLAHVFFNELVRQMEGAFLEEATRRFGQPTVKSTVLKTSSGS